jgi:NAD(P)-dependent dehydrogenase (short-subunit alcohol dehydrogenase family)
MEWYFILLICLIFPVLYIALRCYFNGPRTKLSKDMTDKIIVITGCSAGIGKETARELLNKGATVIFACRNEQKTKSIINEIAVDNKNKGVLLNNKSRAHYINLNLASFKSVVDFSRNFKKQFDRLDILINNAGIVNHNFQMTEDSNEEVFQTNHLSHTLLTGLLMTSLLKSDDPRVINVGSDIHKIAKMNDAILKEPGFTIFENYALSKIGNAFLTRAINIYNPNVKAVTVHPGAIDTDIPRIDQKPWYLKLLFWLCIFPIIKIGFKTALMGAQTTLYCSYLDRKEVVPNGYYVDCKKTKEGKSVNDEFERFMGKLTKDRLLEVEVLKAAEPEDKVTCEGLLNSFL